ncbi:GNAT family N-acetyltransferase [Priestia megaterium]|uniref:GNAT family N-acetyltransferase n=1 Tax=Priestia megaterium TaxID=1404 RepID=UPI002D804DFC|nr:GNAT family N-acetyltransferase [Priestia megaterium]MEB4861062.1 GNAT family N-acetyltransferase [Priestia megaterium]
MYIRNSLESDYEMLIDVVNDWWQGRQMSQMLPRLFFQHFNKTSFILERDEKILGFLIGFISQTNEKDAYIHFVGIHPQYRGSGLGATLYRTFFDKVKKYGCSYVKCVTSPINQNSIAYHTHMGFEIVKGDGEIGGITVHRNYDGTGEDRVVFGRKI